MKLKKVAALCGQKGVFILFNQVDSDGEVVCQWLSDGIAAYPMAGLPYMDTDNICAMFDISEKKQEKLAFRHKNAPESINWDDTDPSERQLGDPKLCVRYECRELLPLRTSEGIVFIQEKYLAPLDNLDYMRLYERRSTGGVYIVAKVGMMIQAVIMPMDVVNEGFVDQMDDLTDMCRAALVKKNRMKTERDREDRDQGQSTLFQEGGNAGEGAGEDAVG